MAELDQAHESYELGMHTEQLSGRTQQVFFSAEESDNLVYPWAPEVDFDKSSEIDAKSLDQQEVNAEIRRLMSEGVGTITVRNPGAKHSLGVGILSRLNLHFDGSLGYFGCGLLDGPNVTVSGRVGWSCGENMMAGTVLIEKNGGSTFGAAIRGGDDLNEWYQTKFVPHLEADANATNSEIGDDSRYFLSKFAFEPPELGSVKELFDRYKGEIEDLD